MSEDPAGPAPAPVLRPDPELEAVQRQLEALQDQKQAFLNDLAPLPPGVSPPPVPALPLGVLPSAQLPAEAQTGPDLAAYLREAADLDQALHLEYCALTAQGTEERAAVVRQYGEWQAEDAKRLAEIAHKRRALQAAYIAEREAVVVRDYENRLAALQAENSRLRAALAATQPGRRPDLGVEVVGAYQRGQRGVQVMGVAGAALEAGLEAGDIITGLGWHAKVDSAGVFSDTAARVRPGDLVTIDAYRHGLPISFHIVAKAPVLEAHASLDRSGARHPERRLFWFPVTDRLTSPRAPAADPLGPRASPSPALAASSPAEFHAGLQTSLATLGEGSPPPLDRIANGPPLAPDIFPRASSSRPSSVSTRTASRTTPVDPHLTALPPRGLSPPPMDSLGQLSARSDPRQAWR